MSEREKRELQITPANTDSHPAIPGIHHVPEFLQFVSWFATPGQFREPETQKEFAASVGVCEDTVSDWKKHPQFWPMVYTAVSEWTKERIPDAVGGLYARVVKKGDPKAVEMFLRLGGIENRDAKSKSKETKNK